MIVIHNITKKPVIIKGLNGETIEFPVEKAPITILSRNPFRKVFTIDGKSFTVEGNTVSIEGKAGFPHIEPGIFYIVSEELANLLRKSHRGASDLIIAKEGKDGSELFFANSITELSDDELTTEAIHKTWENVIIALKYGDNTGDRTAPTASDR